MQDAKALHPAVVYVFIVQIAHHINALDDLLHSPPDGYRPHPEEPEPGAYVPLEEQQRRLDGLTAILTDLNEHTMLDHLHGGGFDKQSLYLEGYRLFIGDSDEASTRL